MLWGLEVQDLISAAAAAAATGQLCGLRWGIRFFTFIFIWINFLNFIKCEADCARLSSAVWLNLTLCTWRPKEDNLKWWWTSNGSTLRIMRALSPLLGHISPFYCDSRQQHALCWPFLPVRVHKHRVITPVRRPEFMTFTYDFGNGLTHQTPVEI